MPPPVSGAPEAAEARSDSMERPPAEDEPSSAPRGAVGPDSTTPALAVLEAPPPAPRPPEPLRRAVDEPIDPIPRPRRNDEQLKDIKKVNEYAFWCIKHGLWQDARSHLEQAARRDSMSASVFNNLGIVYERLGDEEKAEAAYKRARALNPQSQVYLGNFQQLEQRLQNVVRAPAAGDSLGRGGADSLQIGSETYQTLDPGE